MKVDKKTADIFYIHLLKSAPYMPANSKEAAQFLRQVANHLDPQGEVTCTNKR